MVMEALQSHNLLSVSWRTTKTDEVIHSELEGLGERVGESVVVVFDGVIPNNPQNQKQEEVSAQMSVSAQEEREKICPSSAFWF